MDTARFCQMRRAFEQFPTEDARKLLAFMVDETLGNTLPFDPDITLMLDDTRKGRADLPEMADGIEYLLEVLPFSHPGKQAVVHASALAGMADYVDAYRENAETKVFSTGEGFISDLVWHIAPADILTFCGSLHRILAEKVSFHPETSEKHADCANSIENAWDIENPSVQQTLLAQSVETFSSTAELLGHGKIPEICLAASRLAGVFQASPLGIVPARKASPPGMPVPSHINALFLGLHAVDIIIQDKTCDSVLLAGDPSIYLSLHRMSRLGRILGRNGLAALDPEETSHLMEDVPGTLYQVADTLHEGQNFTSDHLLSDLLESYAVFADDASFHIGSAAADYGLPMDEEPDELKVSPSMRSLEDNIGLVLFGNMLLNHAMMNYPRSCSMPWTTLEALNAFTAACERLDEKYENDEYSANKPVSRLLPRLLKLSVTMEKQLARRGLKHESEVCRALAMQALAFLPSAQIGLLLEIPNWQERRAKTVSRFTGLEPEVIEVKFRGKKRGNTLDI